MKFKQIFYLLNEDDDLRKKNHDAYFFNLNQDYEVKKIVKQVADELSCDTSEVEKLIAKIPSSIRTRKGAVKWLKNKLLHR